MGFWGTPNLKPKILELICGLAGIALPIGLGLRLFAHSPQIPLFGCDFQHFQDKRDIVVFPSGVLFL
jgi:hypothetical protein